MDRKRNEEGKFVETVTTEAVLAVLRESKSPIVTATEVGETLGCTAEAARQKLLSLQEQGLVARQQVGGSAVVWWLSKDEQSPEDGQEIDPDDPLFTGGALFASEEPIEAEHIDNVLYGSVED